MKEGILGAGSQPSKESEGIGSQAIAYSSQDIIGESIAHKNKNFFVRLKKRSSLRRSHLHGREKTNSNPRHRFVTVVIICLGALLIGGITALIIMILSQGATTDMSTFKEDEPLVFEDDEPRSQDEILEEANSMSVNSSEEAEKFTTDINELLGIAGEEALDAAKKAYEEKIEKTEEASAQIVLKINYARLLIGDSEVDDAEEIISGISEDGLSLEQKEGLYAVYRYLYETTRNQELFNKYDALLDEVMSELYKPVNVDMEKSTNE